MISSIFCFCSSLSGKWAAIVSAKRPASSMPASEVRISGGIFLFSLTYCSNWLTIARRKASISAPIVASGAIGTNSDVKCVSTSCISVTRARCAPSTRTLTVPSGNFSICKMVATQPISYTSSGVGSSFPADFWAASMMLLPASIAASSARIERGRPTNSGITIWGNTTTSRNGNRGKLIASAGRI